MSLRNLPGLIFAFISLIMLAACGDSGRTVVITPPPSGSFTNADLNGTYVFSTNGVDSSAVSPLSLLGVITADGNGGITGGAIDVVGPNFGVNTNQTLGASTYTITADGRGSLSLIPSDTSFATINMDFVLTQTGHGLITHFSDFNDPSVVVSGSGSGTIDRQSSSTTQPTGSYSFALAGIDGNFDPLATAGTFTFGSGDAVTGVQDINDFGIVLTNEPLSGTVTVGTGTAPGVATISTGLGEAIFDFYVVDSNHIKFLETDFNIGITAGDAFTSQSALPTGTLAFTMSGVDSGFFPLAGGGTMSSDGTAITAGAEDFNDFGLATTTTGIPFTGTFGAISGGRATMTFDTFSPGNSFAAYPSSGGMLMVETDPTATMLGTAFVQTSTSLATSKGYGLNLQAFNSDFNSEEDDIAEFSASSTDFTGLVDFNDAGITDPAETMSGPYTLSGGRGTATIDNPSFLAFHIIFYPVDGSRFIFINDGTDDMTGTGSFGLQSAPAASAMLLHAASVHAKTPVSAHRRLSDHPRRQAQRKR